MAGGADHLNGCGGEGIDVSFGQVGVGPARAIAEGFREYLPPVVAMGFGQVVPIKKDFQVSQRRFVPVGDPHGSSREKVQIGYVVFMPMAQPHLVHPFSVADIQEALFVGGRIDYYSRSLDIKGMTVGIAPTVDAGNEPNRSEMYFLATHDV